MKIIKFQADWCVPCKALTKVLEQIDTKTLIEVVDIDEKPEVAVEYGIRSVPTLVKLDENNNVIERLSGLKEKSELEVFLND
jgi:thioredoxin 1